MFRSVFDSVTIKLNLISLLKCYIKFIDFKLLAVAESEASLVYRSKFEDSQATQENLISRNQNNKNVKTALQK